MKIFIIPWFFKQPDGRMDGQRWIGLETDSIHFLSATLIYIKSYINIWDKSPIYTHSNICIMISQKWLIIIQIFMTKWFPLSDYPQALSCFQLRDRHTNNIRSTQIHMISQNLNIIVRVLHTFLDKVNICSIFFEVENKNCMFVNNPKFCKNTFLHKIQIRVP